MDTTAVSGISTAREMPQVNAPSPVATVRPPANSDAAGAHDPKTAGQDRRARAETSPPRPGEERTRETADEHKFSEDYQSLSERIAEETELRIDRDAETGRIIFQTVRTTTGEVLRQVPSEQMVSLAKSIREAQGLLVDRQA